ncbi:MAG TPA: ATP-binding cassette domain-containing protein [Taishania sp.]|nr:ATP-binding cassette domain-containing protein [Taishania sp.]HNS42504.1 ATP-binding cassette domain-containing protein [Taishania sp.]
MKISLNKVMPIPLASINHGANSIWGNEVELLPGKKIMLNAASGKGKSTFTYTTTGLRNDYSGAILYDDRDVKTFSVEEWTTIRQTKISTVFQDLQLFPTLTVKENLLLKNKLTSVFSESELKEKLDQLGIADKWEQRCGLLSMGQQQRVAIIRALAQPFEWLIMDEPFSHLDEANTQLCLAMINKRADELNAGFVLTSLGDDHAFQYDYTLNL